MNVKIAERIKRMEGREMTHIRVRFAREVSLWTLLARGTIYKILAILAVMAGVEVALFLWSLDGRLRQTPLEYAGFVPVLNFSGAVIVFMVALCLVVIVLFLCETEHGGSRWGYTLDRLLISDRHQTLVRFIYNILCFVLLFGVQAWVGLWMCGLYAERVPGEIVSPQLTFLAFYQSSLLHNVLPLAESAKWVRNVLMILALSAELAVARKRRNFGSIGILPSLSILWMVEDVGFHATQLVADTVCIAMIIDAVLQFFGLWRVDESIQEEA